MKKKVAKKVSLDSVNAKLDALLAEQALFSKEQKHMHADEEHMLSDEEQELSGLHKLEQIEKAIASSVESHPLKRLTLQDIAQGTVGAFIGVLAHFTFIYGVKVAEQISVVRAFLLFPLSLALGAVFLYATGFRRVPKKFLWYLPIRLFVLFFIAIGMAALVLFIFEPGFGANAESFKQVATVSLMGLIGAITADLIGKH